MNVQANIRVWAFWAGALGLVLAWSRMKAGDTAEHVWIEFVTQTVGFAAIGALAAYVKNRLAK